MRTFIASACAVLLLTAATGAEAKKHKKKPPDAAATPKPAEATDGTASGTAADAPKKKTQHHSWPTPALGPSQSGTPEILFTFDDGPSAEYTPVVLDSLEKHGIKAIFFMVGNRVTGFGAKPKLHALIQRILDSGHAIGNHTVNHKDLCKKSSADKIDYEIDQNKKILEEATGMHMVFFRTPFGVRCEQLETALDARHLIHTHWDIDAQEWKTHDATKTHTFITKELGKLGDGQRAVILIHDIHEATAKAIPVILDWIDEENAARTRKGLRPMKVLGPVDIALERMDPALVTSLDGAAAGLLKAIPDVARAVLGPLGGLGGEPAARL